MRVAMHVFGIVRVVMSVIMSVMAVRRTHALIPRGLLLCDDVHLHRSNATWPHAFGGDVDGTNAEREQIPLDAQQIRSQVQQASQQHVASDAARHFDQEGGHGSGCFRLAAWAEA